MKFNNLFIRIILTSLILIQVNSCQYYRIGKVKNISSSYIIEKENEKDYIIVHFEDEVWNLQNISSENDLILGTKRKLSLDHQGFLNNQDSLKKVHRFNSSKYSPKNEVHIYTVKLESEDGDKIIIDIKDITKIEVYGSAGGVTSAAVIGSAAVAAGVFLLIACNCPSVYTYDGSVYNFHGGIFPGAINSTMERDDYIVLDQFSPVNDNYLLKLTNEKPETQYINLAELKVIQHPVETDALYSKYGELLLLSNTESFAHALSSNGADITNVLSNRDGNIELFDDLQTNNGINEVVLTFKKPIKSNNAKLILSVKNSHWMDYVFKEFFSMFGDYYQEFRERQKTQPVKQRLEWLQDQGVFLNVYLDKGKGWEYYDYFNVVGSAKFRDVGLVLDLQDMKDDILRVKLQSGFSFWELDFAGIDFSSDTKAHEVSLQPMVATNQHQNEFIDALSKTDNKYVSKMITGEEIYLEFPSPSLSKEGETTVILHGRGYYEFNYNFHGEPNLSYLKKFRKKGKFSKFSRDKYFTLISASKFSKTN